MAEPDAVPRLNEALEGRYCIERELGRGGMATVYLAGDTRHGRKVALKVLKPDLAAVGGAERFLAEIRTTAKLQHPHIFPEFGSTRQAVLVMVNLPLAVVGGVFAVVLTDGVLNVATMVGFITLFGIAVRNGILMVSHYNHLLDVEGEDLRSAVM